MECDVSDTLLEEIVDKWINIRSHSFAIGWIEQYTLQTKVCVKSHWEKNLQKMGTNNSQHMYMYACTNE